jgi:hypothetical protein
MVCAVADEEPEEELADESFTRLTIYSDTKSAEELATVLGVTSDEAWNNGDARKCGQTYTTTAIALRSRIPGDRPPEDHLEDLLTRVGPLHDRIVGQIAEGSTVRLKMALVRGHG